MKPLDESAQRSFISCFFVHKNSFYCVLFLLFYFSCKAKDVLAASAPLERAPPPYPSLLGDPFAPSHAKKRTPPKHKTRPITESSVRGIALAPGGKACRKQTRPHRRPRGRAGLPLPERRPEVRVGGGGVRSRRRQQRALGRRTRALFLRKRSRCCFRTSNASIGRRWRWSMGGAGAEAAAAAEARWGWRADGGIEGRVCRAVGGGGGGRAIIERRVGGGGGGQGAQQERQA